MIKFLKLLSTKTNFQIEPMVVSCLTDKREIGQNWSPRTFRSEY